MTSTRHVPVHLTRLLLVAASFLLAASPARGAEAWLLAGATSWSPPGGGAPIAMWGYAQCTAGFAACGAPTVPGPALVVPAADATGLTVHLRNALGEPTSLVIPGQTPDLAGHAFPTWTDGTSGPRTGLAQRVRSFTYEAGPGGDADYRWPALRPGTYLYESGTHPQVQVQMGLYGAVTHDAVDAAPPALAQAYPGVEYDQAVTVLYSEIDPVLHAAVADGSYGTTGPTSAFDYHPRYFLVNGAPFDPANPAAALLATVAGGQRTLLRFLNAGLETHIPMLLGEYLDLIAEDGNPYPWPDHPRQQYTVQLTAAKTIDAVMAADNPGPGTLRVAILDRRLDVTNAGAADGGLISLVDVTPGIAAAPPVITSAPPTAALLGASYAYQVVASDLNGDALAYSLDVFPVGMTIGATGLVEWTPTATGSFPVAVRVTDVGGLFAVQGFTVDVTAPVTNHPPVAAADGPYQMVLGGTLAVAAPGILANDSDPDGDALTAVNASAAAGLAVSADGSFTWALTSGSAGTRSFTYQAQDPSAATSAPATVTVGVLANRAPTVVDDTARASRRTRSNTPTYAPVVVVVLANDSDPDTALDPGNGIDPSTVTISAAPNQGGSATVNADGTISYVPRLNFRGTDAFSYRVRDTRGLQSAAATVRVNVR